MKRVVTLSLAALITSTTFVSADSKSEVTSLTNTLLNKLEMPEDSPDWLKRTNFKIQVEENFKPTWELETVQPIKQFSSDDMLFLQFNANTSDEIETYNFGLGYRNIVNPKWMLGVNSFYDYQEKYEHSRWSLGFEALNPRIEFRANRYMAISGKKEVKTDVYEEALGGWDAEFGGQPFDNSYLKTYVGYTVWNAITKDDLKQATARVEYPLNNSINLEIGYTRDNDKQGTLDKSRLNAQLTISLGKKSKSSKNLDRSNDLHDKLLIPVKRENKIIVERTIKAAITIGRGS